MLTRRPALPIAAALLALGTSVGRAADCNQNGIDDFVDVTRGAADCNGNGVPDPCEILPVNLGFIPQTGIPTEVTPLVLLADDIDRDGNVDVAALLAGTSRVLFAWRQAQGVHGIQRVAMGDDTRDINAAMAVGDVDSNGLTDIVAGGPTGVTVLFQNAARVFGLREPRMVSSSVLGSLALADLDEDGDLDIAFAGTFEVRLFLNRGDGTFTDPGSFPAGSGPVQLIAADLDGDGDEDIATSNFLPNVRNGNVSIFLNQGRGNLAAPRNFGVGEIPRSISAGDLDNDGSLDLVIANSRSFDLSILLGRRDGSFEGQVRIPVPGAAFSAAIGDLDGDVDLDIAVATGAAGRGERSSAISLFWNHGGGVLRRAGDIPLAGILPSLAIRDLNGDGMAEIVAADGVRNEIHLLEDTLLAYAEDCDDDQSPDECVLAARDCNGNRLPDGCDIAFGQSLDCDLDGRPDECEPDCNQNAIADDCDLSTGSADCNGNGIPDECDVTEEPSFETLSLAGTGPSFDSLAARDLDADGRPDLLALDASGDINIFWGDGNLGFETVTLATSASRGWTVVPGDTDGDGDLDLVLGNPTVANLKNLALQSARSFAVQPSVILEDAVTSLCTADFDRDGRDDVVAAGFSGDLHFVPGNADGTLGPARRTASSLGPALAAADIDADGEVDIACVLVASRRAAIVWNDGGATFSAPAILSTLLQFTRVATADLDGDGDGDVAAFRPGSLLVFFQSSPRTFELGAEIEKNDVTALVLADVDRNGLGDIVLAHGGSNMQGIELHRTMGGRSFDAAPAIPVLRENGFAVLAAADFDGDGGTDLVAGLHDGGSSRAFILRNNTPAPRSSDRNRNGKPDECEAGTFRRSDSDGDGALNLADAVLTLDFLFQGGAAPGCMEAADADNDGLLGLSDPVSVLEFLFRGGPPPALPGPPPGPCGLDPDAPGSAGDLGCDSYPSC